MVTTVSRLLIFHASFLIVISPIYSFHSPRSFPLGPVFISRRRVSIRHDVFCASRSRKKRGDSSNEHDNGKRSRRRRIDSNKIENGYNVVTGLNNRNTGSPKPRSYKKSSIRIEAAAPLDSKQHDIVIIEIDDEEWWKAKTLLEEDGDENGNRKEADNPFGTKVWPSALAVAHLLARIPSPDIQNRRVLELGCGTGLASISAAAMGANAVATDVSTTALQLTSRGWAETKKKIELKSVIVEGSLSTRIFDVKSNESLRLPSLSERISRDELPPIVIATSIMYESNLAEAMAARIAEAAALGAWVVVADCDSGQREGGRQRFESALEKLLKASNSEEVFCEELRWTTTTVKSSALSWREKRVGLMQLNSQSL